MSACHAEDRGTELCGCAGTLGTRIVRKAHGSSCASYCWETLNIRQVEMALYEDLYVSLEKGTYSLQSASQLLEVIDALSM